MDTEERMIESRKGAVCAENAALLAAATIVFAAADTLSHIVGHSALFEALAVAPFAVLDGKVFFEIGLLASSAVLIALPRYMAAHRVLFSIGSSTALAVGLSGCLLFARFGLGSETFAAALLFVFGAGFMGIKFFSAFELFRKGSFFALLFCVVAGKMIKTVAAITIVMAGTEAQLASTAAILAFAVGAAIWLLLHGKSGLDSESDAAAGKLPFSYLIGQAMLASIMLASVQAFTPFGSYGKPIPAEGMHSIAYAAAVLSVPLVAWLVFVRPNRENGNYDSSYRKAFLIMLFGMLVISSYQFGAFGASEYLSIAFVAFLEPFCHAVFWLTVVSACWIKRDEALRIMGGAIAAFAGLSIL